MALPASILQAGTRAAQPTPVASQAGILYLVTDEPNFPIERWSGTAWVPVNRGTTQLANNLIINGGFVAAQRQVAGTLTTYSQTAARGYGADRWAVTNENASIQYVRGFAGITPETGLTAAFYGTYSKITNAGKIAVSQVIENIYMQSLRGKTVTLQMKMKASGATTMRVALLQLSSAGTLNVVPGYASGAPSGTFISAFNADGTDPTFGTNLAKITPVTADNATIASTALTCSVTTAWQQFGGTFVVPADCLNLIVVVYSNADIAVASSFSISEVALFVGNGTRQWVDPDGALEVLRCQRYYVKTFDFNTAPAQNAGLAGAIRGHVSVAGATANQPIGYRFPVLLLGTGGTFTFYNPSNTDAFVRNTTAGTNATATAAANTSLMTTDILFTGIAAWTVAQSVAVHMTYDTEI